MHEITINDNVNYQKHTYLEDFFRYCLDELNVQKAIFSVTFVDDLAIQSINRDYRGKDSVTDVISFAFEEKSKIVYNDFRFLGDIYICIPRMIVQSIEYRHSEKRELCFLSIHGLLHLLGYDHQTPTEEEVMFKLQEMLLNGKNIKR